MPPDAIRDPSTAFNVLRRHGFQPHPKQAITGGSGEVRIWFVHTETDVEFGITLDQWEVLEPFFTSEGSDAAPKLAALRAAAGSALEVIETRIAPYAAAAGKLKRALEL